jgi:hypothetical protein
MITFKNEVRENWERRWGLANRKTRNGQRVFEWQASFAARSRASRRDDITSEEGNCSDISWYHELIFFFLTSI